MKKITDLSTEEGIHCQTQEEWNNILDLNPDNDITQDCWLLFKENSVYLPASYDYTGDFCSIHDRCECVYEPKEFLVDDQYPELDNPIELHQDTKLNTILPAIGVGCIVVAILYYLLS